jgi:CRP-like cAMP-binding protein
MARKYVSNALPRVCHAIVRTVFAAVVSKIDERDSEGERADFFYKIISGTLCTYRLSNDGRRPINASGLSLWAAGQAHCWPRFATPHGC